MFSSPFNTSSMPADGTRYATEAEPATAQNTSLAALRIIDAGYFGNLHGEWSSSADNDTADGYVMLYCIDGCADYTVGGNSTAITRHRFIIHDGRAEAAYTVPPGKSWSVYRIRFTGTIARDLVGEIANGEFFSPGDILGAEIAGRIEEILVNIERDASLESQLYCSALLHYVIGTVRRFTTMVEHNSTDSSEEIVDAAIRYMKENLSKKLSLQDLTEMTNYSKPHFMTIFKRATGHSPMSYFNMLKIMKACTLLDTTDMKINQICFAIGINDMFYFSRLFKKYMHVSPSSYRTRHSNQVDNNNDINTQQTIKS